ncbi:hypothetical protein [Faecalibacterium prausnitzii]|uniref:hypothetical protein n=1 Tax=Faecalibacterium prausnitzii TaxID=853 RepID=UPI001CBE9A99|nr:hypothetical protein [Faecalibacterium prausnitzii]
MRDALSILDTCAGVTAKIDADVVRRMAGVTDRSYLFHISDALERRMPPRHWHSWLSCVSSRWNVKRLTEELIAHYRALMLRPCPAGSTALGVSRKRKSSIWKKAPGWGSGRRSGPSGLWATLWST